MNSSRFIVRDSGCGAFLEVRDLIVGALLKESVEKALILPEGYQNVLVGYFEALEVLVAGRHDLDPQPDEVPPSSTWRTRLLIGI